VAIFAQSDGSDERVQGGEIEALFSLPAITSKQFHRRRELLRVHINVALSGGNMAVPRQRCQQAHANTLVGQSGDVGSAPAVAAGIFQPACTVDVQEQLAHGVCGMTALDRLLQSYRDAVVTEREKGIYFEPLALAYFQNVPVQSEEYEADWTWADWAKTNGRDAKDVGIDLVAKLRNEGFAALPRARVMA